MVLAVLLHVWGVRSTEPREPVYTTLASRLVASVVGSPTLPLAPPLQLAMRPRAPASEDVTIDTRALNVPPVPASPVSSPAATGFQLVAVGTSGTTIGRAADTSDVVRGLAPAAPSATANLDDEAPPSPSDEPRFATMTAGLTTVPLGELRIPPAVSSLDRLAPPATRVVLPADRKEADPRDATEDRRYQEEVVLAVLHEYTRALERFDVGATKAIYPSVDDRRLRESFEDVETQRFHFGKCGVSFSLSGHDANAWCIGNSTFRPKVGSRVIKYSDQAWLFSLARHGAGWQIREARIE